MAQILASMYLLLGQEKFFNGLNHGLNPFCILMVVVEVILSKSMQNNISACFTNHTLFLLAIAESQEITYFYNVRFRLIYAKSHV